MRSIKIGYFIVLILTSLQAFGQEGPYSPAAGMDGSIAIHKDSDLIVAWANSVVIERGYQDINDMSFGLADYGEDDDCLGSANELVVSLGDGGIATYYLSTPISDGPGYDFAIFENAFNDNFLELAFVEVSSDDENYYRFENISLVQDSIQVDAFGFTDPTQIYNLAGQFRVDYGTPFDLSELDEISGLNTGEITSVRIIDVIGNINEPNTSFDSNGNPINDPYPTQFSSSGFDLNALGIINQITGIQEYKTGLLKTYPNPFEFRTLIELPHHLDYKVVVRDSKGNVVLNKTDYSNVIQIDLSNHPNGLYIAEVITMHGIKRSKLLKSDRN